MKIGWQLFAFAIILTVASVNAGKCKKCDSISDPNCVKDPKTAEDIDCATNCFVSVDSSGKIKRGCLGESEKCEGNTCKSCPATDSACNNQADLFWCKSCDSASNADCAYWKNENSIPNEFCESGVNKCLMEIKADKHTSRRCASKNDEACENAETCKTCTDNSSCNKGVHPEDRRKCFQCNSDDSKCATPTKYSTEISSFPCQLYEKSDKCFEHGSSDTAMARGCLSDTSAYGKCSSESPKEKCKECTTDGCNVDEYKVDPTVKCIQCKSDDDPKCVETHKAEDGKACSTKTEYWKSQGCFTNKIAVGKIERGCLMDFDCASASGTCTPCNTTDTACNIAALNETFCYKCRSDENPKCSEALDKESFKSEPCRNQMESNDEQCYIENWDGIIIRSCIMDADSKTRKNCLNKDYKLCEVCKGDNCNSGKVPNSAKNIALASGLLAISLLILKFF